MSHSVAKKLPALGREKTSGCFSGLRRHWGFPCRTRSRKNFRHSVAKKLPAAFLVSGGIGGFHVALGREKTSGTRSRKNFRLLFWSQEALGVSMSHSVAKKLPALGREKTSG